jgi:hypothetical protein
MPQDARDYRLLGDSGNDAQRAATAKWARGHIQMKHASQQPCPTPIPDSRFSFLPVHTLLAQCGHDRVAQFAVWRQTASVANEIDARQGHERSQLLQKLQRREFDTDGAVGPRPREPVKEVSVGILFEPLKRHGASSSIANQTFQLIPPMHRNLMPSSCCAISPVRSSQSHPLPCNLNTLTHPWCSSSWSTCNGCEAMRRVRATRG